MSRTSKGRRQLNR